MSAPSRSAQFSKLYKVLKKYYKPTVPDEKRSVLEHILFACCLENAHYEAAQDSYAALVHNFFDWNEVRVSTARELSEVMARLPEPVAAATRLKRVLQGVFEASYNFELEELRKMNLGPATEKLTKLKGSTPFSVGYVVQAALGGHWIPLDAGTLGAMRLLGMVSEADVRNSVAPGLERAIPKNKGFEFASLLHQLGADFAANPYSPSLHAILVEIAPEVRDHLPKRRKPGEEVAAAEEGKGTKKGKKAAQAETKPEKAVAAPAVEAQTKRGAGKKKGADEPAKGHASKEKGSEAKPSEAQVQGAKPAAKAAEASAEKTSEAKPTERKKAADEALVERKKAAPAEEKTPPPAKKKPPTPKKEAKEVPPKEPPAKKKESAEKEKPSVEPARKQREAGPKESGPSGLAKRKPR